MILIELFVPCRGRTYNIKVKESQKAGILLEEMLALVKIKTGDPADGPEAETQNYELFSVQTGACLKKDLPVSAQGVRDGSRLVLV